MLVGTTAGISSGFAATRDDESTVRAARASSPISTTFSTRATRSTATAAVRLAARLEGDRASRRAAIIDVRGFRYRNLPIGDTAAAWSSARNEIVGTLAVGGKEGSLRAARIDRTRACARLADHVHALALRSLRGRQRPRSLALDAGAGHAGRADYRARRRRVRPCVGVSRFVNLRGNAAIVNGGRSGRSRSIARKPRVHSAGRAIAVDNAELVDARPHRQRRPGRSGCGRSTRSTCRCTRRPTTCRSSSTKFRGCKFR